MLRPLHGPIEYVRVVGHQWLLLMGGAVMATAGYVANATSVVVPGWVLWLIALLLVSCAQYRAYRELRARLFQYEALEAAAYRVMAAHELTNETVRVADLITNDTHAVIHAKTFRECTLIGPAVMQWRDCTARYCTWEGDAEQVFYPRHTAAERRGLVVFLACTFDRCTFLNLGAYGDESLLELLRTIPKV